MSKPSEFSLFDCRQQCLMVPSSIHCFFGYTLLILSCAPGMIHLRCLNLKAFIFFSVSKCKAQVSQAHKAVEYTTDHKEWWIFVFKERFLFFHIWVRLASADVLTAILILIFFPIHIFSQGASEVNKYDNLFWPVSCCFFFVGWLLFTVVLPVTINLLFLSLISMPYDNAVLSNARRFYLSMENLLGVKGLSFLVRSGQGNTLLLVTI